MMVILEDKENDIKQSFFYDRVPVGGRMDNETATLQVANRT
jgi:hypothetical protein